MSPSRGTFVSPVVTAIRRTTAAAMVVSVTATTACQTLDNRPSLQQAVDLVHQRVGVEGIGRPLDHTELPWGETGLLSCDDAVAAALRGNPAIAADLAVIRQAHAEYVQAGLLPNPVLTGSLGFESGGITTLTASLSQALSALWQLPSRQAAADAHLQQTILRVSQSTLDLAAEVQRLHRQVVHHQQHEALLDEQRELVEAMVQTARDRFTTGLGDARDVGRYEAELHGLLGWQLENTAELAAVKRHLLEAMGLSDAPTDWTATAQPLSAVAATDESQAVPMALASRLDVQAAHWSTVATGHALTLAGGAVWPHVDAGVEFEREDGRIQIGPEAAVSLPIFDQGQAHTAAAQAQHERQQAMTQTKIQQTTRQVRQAWLMVQARQQQFDHHRDTTLPHVQAMVAQAEAAFATGDADRLDVLIARRDLLSARRQLADLSLACDLATIAYKHASGWTGVQPESVNGVPL